MTITTKALFAAGIVSLLGIATPKTANAHDRDRQYDRYRTSARAESSRMSELQRDRAELRRDQAELARDREDLQRLYRLGASRQAIDRKRQEIRDDLRELAQDHREVSESLENLNRGWDRGFDWDRYGSSSDRRGRYENTGWGWSRDDRYDRSPLGWGLSDLFGWR